MSDPGRSGPNTVVFVHGLWMNPKSWENWIARYEAEGMTCIAPAWPGAEGDPAQLRKDPSPIAKTTIRDVLDRFEQVIRGLDRPPIIMGHSFGGLFTKILIDRGLGAAAVSISGGQPKGVLKLPLSTVRSGKSVLLNPLNRRGVGVPFPIKDFKYAFGNTLSESDSLAAYNAYAIPAASKVFFEGAMALLNPKAISKVDYARPGRAPLLLIAAGKDHVVPPSVTRAIYGKYAQSRATLAYKEYPTKSHFIAGEPGWEEVADFALEWALNPVPIPAP